MLCALGLGRGLADSRTRGLCTSRGSGHGGTRCEPVAGGGSGMGASGREWPRVIVDPGRRWDRRLGLRKASSGGEAGSRCATGRGRRQAGRALSGSGPGGRGRRARREWPAAASCPGMESQRAAPTLDPSSPPPPLVLSGMAGAPGQVGGLGGRAELPRAAPHALLSPPARPKHAEGREKRGGRGVGEGVVREGEGGKAGQRATAVGYAMPCNARPSNPPLPPALAKRAGEAK